MRLLRFAVPLAAAALLVLSTPPGWRWLMWLAPGEERHDLDSLDPVFRERLEGLLARLEERGWHPVIRATWRDQRRQSLYHRLGGSQKASGSLHQATADGVPAARAADVGDLWTLADVPHFAEFHLALRELAPGHGLVTGGTWTRRDPRWAACGLGWDPAHVQMAD